MSIEFGLSRLRAYTNGIGSGCVITTGGAGNTAVVASGACWIGGVAVVVSAKDVDVSALSPASGTKYIFARFAAGQSATATLDATSVEPKGDNAVLGVMTHASGSFTSYSTSGLTGLRPFGRAQNGTINVTYDNAMARGGTLIFANDLKLYNGNVEGSLEFASISGANLASIYGGSWASGGAGSGTLTITATQSPLPFMIEFQSVTDGVTATYRILKCYSNSLTLNIDRENYTIPSMNYQAVANQEGDLLTVNI